MLIPKQVKIFRKSYEQKHLQPFAKSKKTQNSHSFCLKLAFNIMSPFSTNLELASMSAFLLFSYGFRCKKCFLGYIILAFFANIECICSKNGIFSDILPKSKTYCFVNFYLSPFESHQNSKTV